MITTSTTTDTGTTTSTHEPASATRIQHYAIRHICSPKHHDNRTKIKAAHLCITIRGAGPAFGRPVAAPAAGDLAVDLHKIIVCIYWGWFRWC
jgi:hypothetical protein